MTVERAGAPADVRRSKPERTYPATRAERRATRRIGRQVRTVTGVLVLAVVVSAAIFVARPIGAPASPTAAFGASPLDPGDSPRSVDLSGADNIAAKRAAIARPAEGVLLTHAATQEELMRAAAAAEAARKAKLVRRTNVDWDGIAECETGGNWQMQGSTYSGGVGFANTTWSGFGGREFAPNAGMASREEQIVVAERVYARYGLSGWGCKRYG